MNNDNIQKVLDTMLTLSVKDVLEGNEMHDIIFIFGDNREFVLWVYSAWRVINKDRLVTSWNDCYNIEERNFLLEKLFKYKKLQSYQISNMYDISLILEDDVSIDIFCDITTTIKQTLSNKNWILCQKEKNECYTITSEFKLKKSPYKN